MEGNCIAAIDLIKRIFICCGMKEVSFQEPHAHKKGGFMLHKAKIKY